MDILKDQTDKNIKNFIFTGEAGSGKSEIALNFAKALTHGGEKPVHFFDLDMTKPLFRSRDFEASLQSAGVTCHFSPQFMDAPTAAGWVRRLLRDTGAYAVLDVGGGSAGARAVGRYAALLNGENSAVYFVVNSFRPWSLEAEQVLHTYSKILEVSHLKPEKMRFISNPNLGDATTPEDFLAGCQKTRKLLSPLQKICFACAMRPVYDHLSSAQQEQVFPLEKHMAYL